MGLIAINYTTLEGKLVGLHVLAATLQSRKYSTPPSGGLVTAGLGHTKDEVNEILESLYDIHDEFRELVIKTHKALEDAGVNFAELETELMQRYAQMGFR
jgi:hypothetical protein